MKTEKSLKERWLEKWRKDLKALDLKRDALLRKIHFAETQTPLKIDIPKKKLSDFNKMLSTALNYNPKKK